MRVKDTGGLYSIEPTFGFDELEQWLPLEAILAKHDILNWRNQKYCLIGGMLYAHFNPNPYPSSLDQEDMWRRFNPTYRNWVECQKPEGA